MLREGQTGIPHGVGLEVVIAWALDEMGAVRLVDGAFADAVAFGIAGADATWLSRRCELYLNASAAVTFRYLS